MNIMEKNLINLCIYIFTIFWPRIYDCLKKVLIVNASESNIWLYSKNVYEYIIWWQL